MKQQLPPQSPEIEQAVLGAILTNKQAIEQILDIITDESFYNESNAAIFRAAMNLYKDNRGIDLFTVIDELKRMNKLEYIGGRVYIVELMNKVSSSVNIEYHARILAEQYVKRSMIMLSLGIAKESYQDSSDAFNVLEMGQQMLDKVEKFVAVGKVNTMLDLFYESEKRNDTIISRHGISGIPTGFPPIDKITGGWQSSDFVILAARPGMGKTSLMLNFIRNAAVEFNEPVAAFSLEMSAMQLTHRLQSAETGIALERYMRVGLSRDEVEYNHIKCQKLASAPIYIDDTAGLSIFELKVKLRKLVREKGVKMAVIDYVQLMTVGKGADVHSREQEISYISRNLKAIAKDLNIPVIALSQLSRKVEERADKIPQLSDLRESGSLEQDADLVMFIYRPEAYSIYEDDKGNSTVGKASVMILKHRNGSTDDNIVLGFKGELTKFYTLGESEQPNNVSLQQSDEF